jgi:hypothetical protein
MRKASGLRNKFRTGRSTYSIKAKNRKADKYGEWKAGIQVRSENIAGRVLSYDAGQGEWK